MSNVASTEEQLHWILPHMSAVTERSSFGAMNPVQIKRVDTERVHGLVRVCVETPTSFSEKEVCRSSKFVVVIRKRPCFQARNYYVSQL